MSKYIARMTSDLLRDKIQELRKTNIKRKNDLKNYLDENLETEQKIKIIYSNALFYMENIESELIDLIYQHQSIIDHLIDLKSE